MFSDFMALWAAYRHSREEWSPKEALLGRDRRIFHRVTSRVSCRMTSRLFGLESAGTAINLSLGGAGVLAPVTWPEGSQIRFVLDEYKFDVGGIICFRVDSDQQFRYGIKFDKITMSELQRLRKILRERYKGPLAIL